MNECAKSYKRSPASLEKSCASNHSLSNAPASGPAPAIPGRICHHLQTPDPLEPLKQ